MKLFSQIVALVLLLAVFTGTFSTVIIETAFCIQKEYIAREKCENRANPTAHCDGKCYLKKQLKQDEKREAQGVNFEKLEMIWFQSATVAWPPVITATSIDFTDYHSSPLLPGYLSSVYHPPTV